MIPYVRGMLLALMVAPALLVPALSFAVEVACGDVVPKGGIGELVTDLNCTGPAIVLEHGAVLKMNGHVLSRQPPSPDNGCLYPLCCGVWCRGPKCTVEGPGEISGFPMGIWSKHPTRPFAKGRVVATDVVLRGNNIGMSAGKGVLTNVVAREGIAGLIVERTFLTSVEARANTGEGIIGFKSTGEDVRIQDNLGGFAGALLGSVRWTNATVTGNASDGIQVTRGRLKLIDSVATGNGGADLSSPHAPVLSNTTCDSSSNQAGGDWDVCTND
jgi:hypothetical protein